MPAYIDIATFELDYSPREVLQLSDRTSANVRVDVVIQRAIDRGAAMMDRELARCYVLPLTPMPGYSAVPDHVLLTLSEWNGRIARYLLRDDGEKEGIGSASVVSPPTARYREVMDALKLCDPSKPCGCELFTGVVLNPRAAASAGGPKDSVVWGDSGSRFGRDDVEHGARDATQWGGVEQPDTTAYMGYSGGERETIIRGDSFAREWQWLDSTDTPINITGYTGMWELFRGENILVQSGALTMVNAALGKMSYALSAAQTQVIAAGEYWYRVRYTSVAGFVTVIERRRWQVSS